MPRPTTEQSTAVSHAVFVLATLAGGAVTIFGLYWEAQVSAQIDNSEPGHYVGSALTKLGALCLLLLLGALISAMRQGPESMMAVRLAATALGLSVLGLVCLVVWLVRNAEQADALWRSF